MLDLASVRGFFAYALTHKAAITALVTVLTIVLAHFGIAIPHVNHELVTALLVLLTGFFGVTTDEAAFIGGLLEGHDIATEQHAAEAAMKPGGTA